MDQYYILVFNNTHEAMQGESVCKNEKIKSTMMPTPSYITKSCGISLKINDTEFESVIKLIKDGKFNVKAIFKKEDKAYREIEF